MKSTVVVYKNIGETPLQAINRFRLENPKYENIKISYAGRLDPMAEGLLLFLIGSENKKRDEYLDLDKEYKCKILFGLSTDTFDALGKIIEKNESKDIVINKSILAEKILNFIGEYKQTYPPYSSKPVNGKPLFEWAREGKIEDIPKPEKLVNIFSFSLGEMESISKKEMKKDIEERIGKVDGDFRQKEILEGWNEYFENSDIKKYTIINTTIHCSSGTYVRSIAERLGKMIGTGAIAFHIKRTRIGKFDGETILR